MDLVHRPGNRKCVATIRRQRALHLSWAPWAMRRKGKLSTPCSCKVKTLGVLSTPNKMLICADLSQTCQRMTEHRECYTAAIKVPLNSGSSSSAQQTLCKLSLRIAAPINTCLQCFHLDNIRKTNRCRRYGDPPMPMLSVYFSDRKTLTFASHGKGARHVRPKS